MHSLHTVTTSLTRQEHCCITSCHYNADFLDWSFLPPCICCRPALHRESIRHIWPQASAAFKHWYLYHRYHHLLRHEQLRGIYYGTFYSRRRRWRIFCLGLCYPCRYHSSASACSVSGHNCISLVVCCDNRWAVSLFLATSFPIFWLIISSSNLSAIFLTPARQYTTLILSRSSHWRALFTIHDLEMVFLHQP